MVCATAWSPRPQPIVENTKYHTEGDVPGNRLPERRPGEVAVNFAKAYRRVDVLEQRNRVEDDVFDVGKDDALQPGWPGQAALHHGVERGQSK